MHSLDGFKTHPVTWFESVVDTGTAELLHRAIKKEAINVTQQALVP